LELGIQFGGGWGRCGIGFTISSVLKAEFGYRRRDNGLDPLPAPLGFDASTVENYDVVGSWKKLRCITNLVSSTLSQCVIGRTWTY
jgi:hypothetical protein